VDEAEDSFVPGHKFTSKKLKVARLALKLEQVDAVLVCSFLEHLETTRGNSAETRNVRLAAIRSFFRFLEHREPAAVGQVRRVLAIPFKKLCLSKCGRTGLMMPARCAASRYAAHTILAMIGLSAREPLT
jgi:hypothetical protein